MPVGAAGDFHGSEEGDLTDDAAFFRHSRDIESAFSVQLFVISAGPVAGLSERGRLCGLPFPVIPLQEGGADKGSKHGILGR